MQTTRTLSRVAFQRQCFDEILDFIKQIRIKENLDPGKFQKREATELLKYYSIPEIYEKCGKDLEALVNADPPTVPPDSPLIESLVRPMRAIIDAVFENGKNALRLLDTYGEFAALKKDYLETEVEEENEPDGGGLSASAGAIYIQCSPCEKPLDRKFMDAIEKNRLDKEYLSSVMRVCKDARERTRALTSTETSGVWCAYTLISKGVTLDFANAGLGTSGFRRDRQTFIFTTDPGDDHIRISAADNQLLDGVAVHVEHIDRDQVESKELVEAYRLPAAINAARVRLHISNGAPVTAFIGRPVFENLGVGTGKPIEHKSFSMDKLKAAHMSASACSAMFQNGVADCKIAIERMYLSDAVEFMKCVVGNVFRDPDKQTLAAAFNLNTVYYDDKYQGGECKELTDPFEIAKMAIQVAYDGGFDRVTFDGASNQIPSKPIIEQLAFEQFVELIHTAHEKGLQTYFSAGLEAKHVAECVYTGVDGLGIGTSLHYIDPLTKLMGAFDPQKIRDTLNARNIAERTLKGRAAVLLARLDRMYFEGVLSNKEDLLRKELYAAVCTRDERKLAGLLGDISMMRIMRMKADTVNALIGRAGRTLRALSRIKFPDTEVVHEIKTAMENNDTQGLRAILENFNEGGTLL